MKKRKYQLKVGAKVEFISGNFKGLTGEITTIDWNSKHPNAIHRYYHEVKLSNGNIGYIEKSEHFNILKP